MKHSIYQHSSIRFNQDELIESNLCTIIINIRQLSSIDEYDMILSKSKESYQLTDRINIKHDTYIKLTFVKLTYPI